MKFVPRLQATDHLVLNKPVPGNTGGLFRCLVVKHTSLSWGVEGRVVLLFLLLVPPSDISNNM